MLMRLISSEAPRNANKVDDEHKSLNAAHVVPFMLGRAGDESRVDTFITETVDVQLSPTSGGAALSCLLPSC